jgi:hypothetical protein
MTGKSLAGRRVRTALCVASLFGFWGGSSSCGDDGAADRFARSAPVAAVLAP